MPVLTPSQTITETRPVAVGTTIPVRAAVTYGQPEFSSCYVLGCRETVVHEQGTRKIFKHRRFGAVHACAGHDPARG